MKMTFKIINNRAYTPDDVLIYNILVCNTKINIAKWRIWNYFDRFGKVLRVRRVRFPKTTRKFHRMFIDFKHAEDAAKVLRRTHTIKNKSLRVLACFSWDQPEGAKVCPAAKETADPSEYFRLLQLNDDCLGIIFRTLDVADQLNLAATDPHLMAIFKLNAKREYETMEMNKFKDLPAESMLMFLKIVGRFIKEIFGLIPSKQILKYIGIHCTNLKTVKFTDYEYDRRYPGRRRYIQHRDDSQCALTTNGLDGLLRCTHLLAHIELEVTCLEDESICLLTKLYHLRALSVASNYNLSGKNISAMNNLEMLSLNSCYGLDPLFFSNICKRLTKLKAFDIQSCSRLTTSDFRMMVKHLPGLISLKVSVDIVDSRNLTELKCLKHLYLESSCLVPLNIIRDLATHMGNQLELLELEGFCRNSVEIVPIIGKMSTLKTFRCSSCRYLDDQCINKLANLSNLRELNLRDCSRYTERALLDLMGRCRHLNVLNVVGCNQLTENFFKQMLSLLIMERKQGNFLRHPRITTSHCLYHEYSVDKLNYEAVSLFPKRIFLWDWEA